MTQGDTFQSVQPRKPPQVWVITPGNSSIGISITRNVLARGDYVLFGLARTIEKTDQKDECDKSGQRRQQEAMDSLMNELAEQNGNENGWNQRFKSVILDIREIDECQAAVAHAVSAFGKVDILFCCSSQGMHAYIRYLKAGRMRFVLYCRIIVFLFEL